MANIITYRIRKAVAYIMATPEEFIVKSPLYNYKELI